LLCDDSFIPNDFYDEFFVLLSLSFIIVIIIIIIIILIVLVHAHTMSTRGSKPTPDEAVAL
jgi:hypothetical protein